MKMTEWAKAIHENAVEHGWWETHRDIDEVFALIHSELSEALEEARAGRPMMYVYDEYNGECIENPHFFGSKKPEGIAVELADAVIRLLDWMEQEKLADILRDYETQGEKVCIKVVRSVKKSPKKAAHMIVELHGLLEHMRTAYWATIEKRGRAQKKAGKDFMDDIASFVAGVDVWLGCSGIQLKDVIEIKHRYNKTRPYKHGKLF